MSEKTGTITVEAIRSEILPLCGAEIFQAICEHIQDTPEQGAKLHAVMTDAVLEHAGAGVVIRREPTPEDPEDCPDCADTDEELCELCRVEGPGWRERLLSRARYYMGPK